jgi:hypothetical protein
MMHSFPLLLPLLANNNNNIHANFKTHKNMRNILLPMCPFRFTKYQEGMPFVAL